MPMIAQSPPDPPSVRAATHTQRRNPVSPGRTSPKTALSASTDSHPAPVSCLRHPHRGHNSPSARPATHTQRRNPSQSTPSSHTTILGVSTLSHRSPFSCRQSPRRLPTRLQCEPPLTPSTGITSPASSPTTQFTFSATSHSHSTPESRPIHTIQPYNHPSVRAATHTLRPRWPSALECASRHSHITSLGSHHRYRNPAIPTIPQPLGLAASRFQTKVPATTHTLSESVLSNQQCASRGAHITGNRSPTPALCASGHSHNAGTPPNQPASVRAAAHTSPPPRSHLRRSHLRNVRALTHTLQTHRLAVGSQDAARC